MQTAASGSNYKGVAMAAILVSIISLAVAGYAVYSAWNKPAKKAPMILNYDIWLGAPSTVVVIDNVTKTTSLVGDTAVAIAPIFSMGQIGKSSSVGTYKCLFTFTSNNGFGEDLSLQVLNITSMGQLFVVGLEPPVGNVLYPGAITGGTGQFVGAQGTAGQSSNTNGTIISFFVNITSTATS